MSEVSASYYPNALCFEDKSAIRLVNNWFDSTFKNLYIAIEACNDDTYHKDDAHKKCEKESVIHEFVEDNIFYYIN